MAEFAFAVPKELTLRAVALNCGKYVIGSEEEKSLDGSPNGLMADYLEQGGVPAELDQINVLLHMTENFPPTFVMTCTGDFLQDQALPHVFHRNVRSEDAKQCNAEENRFFRKWEKK